MLDKAVDWLEATPTINKGLDTALLSRLRFRKALLVALDFEQGITDADRANAWERCADILPKLLETKDLGTAVEDAFSGKIQRRLASSVPPRPVVHISFEEAHAFLERLCVHGQEAYGILRYSAPSSAMVSTVIYTSQGFY